MAEENSISTFLPQFLRLFNNSIESFEIINQAITSNRESVSLDIQNEDGSTSRITIPGFGFLKNSIDRLDKNIQTISNVDGGNSSLRLPDGSFRKLILSDLPTEAKDIESINSVNNFNIKSNWFFEELINPLMYISFDISGQVKRNTERAIIKRYILETNTKSKINFFNNNYNGLSNINYNDFLKEVVNNNISYVLDESVIDLPPKSKKYTGNFSVLRISDTEVTEEVNGITIKSNKKSYKLNKITYSDVDFDFSDTLQLNKGDVLEVNSDNIDTRYKIIEVDSSTNSVILELIEGSKAIPIGADVLKISSNLDLKTEIDVNIGFDERCVTFIKPIDPSSKIPATNWSPGSGFYTNDLKTVDSNGNEQSLLNFYKDNVIDFGKFLLSFAQDKFPTTKEGLKPNKPEIFNDNFKVVPINKQLTDSPSFIKLKELDNEKNKIESKLKELDDAIKKKRKRVQTTNYTTEVERDTDKNELNNLISERLSESESYESLVKEILSKAKNSSVESISPKYRVRGFWKIPKERVSESTGTQHIIKFKVRYRYLSETGSSNQVEQIKYIDGDTETQGSFSNYNEFETLLRPRIKDTVTGKYIWDNIDTEKSDLINTNQLDIPIRKGEIVEFQIKSISEAGWPSNPLESEWSEPTRVEFPSDLSSDNEIEDIVKNNREDLSKIKLEEDLNSKGLNEHLATQFTSNEKLFAHNANSIFSGFVSENQNPVDLFVKLTEMQNKLTQLEEILKSAKGKLSLMLVDENGNNIKINRDANTKVFSGFYSNEVLDLDDPRGAIISKTFFLNIANTKQTPLQLIASIAGSRTRMVKQSENPSFNESDALNGTVILPATYNWLDNSESNQNDNRPTYTSNDADYNKIRKYDIVPISLTNPIVDVNNKFGQIKSLIPYQSTQNKNQYIYSRYRDVSSDDNFYSYINPDGDFVINLDTAENFYNRESSSVNSDNNEFIWGGGFNENGEPTTTSSFFDSEGNDIEVHIEHPIIKNYNSYKQYCSDILNEDLPTLDNNIINCTVSGNKTAPLLFRQSKFSSLKSDENLGKKQSIYLNEDYNSLQSLIGFENYPITLNSPNNNNNQEFRGSFTVESLINESDNLDNYSRNVKSSFDTFDQYLLGRRSCGSYLFIASDDHENIQVSGDSIQSSKKIEFGNQNSINIPIVFQYRMTDYFGSGSGEDGGIGNIGGDNTGSTTNLTYSKKIGIDIYPNGESVVQFDLEFFAKYRSDNLNINVFPSASVTRGLNDLEKVVNDLNPTIKESQSNSNFRDNSSLGFEVSPAN